MFAALSKIPVICDVMHKMKIIILAAIFLIQGCIAIPRGTYLQPQYPGGELVTGTCDYGGNKIGVDIPLTDHINLRVISRPLNDQTYVVRFGFSIPKSKHLKVESNFIEYSINFGEKSRIYVPQWDEQYLQGKDIELYPEIFVPDYFGGEFSDGEGVTTLEIIFPAVSESGNVIPIGVVRFVSKSGGIHWVPALNC